MTRKWINGLVVIGGVLMLGAALQGAQRGDYILLVGDYTDVSTGCYRYEVTIR